MNYPTREIEHIELSDELRDIEKFGIDTPKLNRSKESIEYLGTTEDDVEIYTQGKRVLRVGPGSVIDNHGNVVDIFNLRRLIGIIKQSSYCRPKDGRVKLSIL